MVLLVLHVAVAVLVTDTFGSILTWAKQIAILTFTPFTDA